MWGSVKREDRRKIKNRHLRRPCGGRKEWHQLAARQLPYCHTEIVRLAAVVIFGKRLFDGQVK